MIVKMHIFREFLLDHEDLVSGMSFVLFYNAYSKMFLTRLFCYFSIDFQIFCCTFCEKLDTQLYNVPRKYFFYI